MIYLSYTLNIRSVADLAMQGFRASAEMVLTLFFQIISVSAHKGLMIIIEIE